MAQMNIARTLADADAAWAAMTPDERKSVEEQLAKGATPMRAVNLVRSQRRQDAARSGVEADTELAEPTTAEARASVAQGMADRVGQGMAPAAAGLDEALSETIPSVVPKGARKAVAGAGMLLAAPAVPMATMLAESGLLPKSFTENYQRGRDEQQGESDAAASGKRGAFYGAGQLGGAAVDAGMAAAGGAQSVATTKYTGVAPALEELLGKRGAATAREGGRRLGNAGREIVRDAAQGEVPSKIGAVKRAVKALLQGEKLGPVADEENMAREAFVRDVSADPYGVAPDDANVGGSGVTREFKALQYRMGLGPDAPPPAPRPPAPSGSLDDLVEAHTSLPPDDPGLPPSMMADRTPTPATPDWRVTPEQLAAGELPPEAQADIARLRPSGRGTTPPPSTVNARKPITMDDLAEAHAGPAQIDPDVAAEKAAIGRDAANGIATGEMSPRAAGGMARAQARAAAAPKTQAEARAALETMRRNNDPLMKQPSKNIAKIAKRLGMKPSAVKMAIDAMSWGR